MAENSAISWTDHTFNPWIGCAKVSPACDGCYAEAQFGMPSFRSAEPRALWGAPGRGEGTRVRTAPSTWKLPRKWNREAASAPGKTFVFCASLADVFDNAVDPTWRAELFVLIHETPNLTWLLLTKRPGNIVKLAPTPWPKNAAIGCTIVTQDEADRDIPKLLAAKAALKPAFAFLSMEPLLGQVDLSPWLAERFVPCERNGCLGCPEGNTRLRSDGAEAYSCCDRPVTGSPRSPLEWVITGGETDQGGHKARPADPAWFRSLRDQCAAAGVPFHFKQWGEWQPVREEPWLREGDVVFRGTEFVSQARPVRRLGKGVDPCTLDGVKHDARPEVVR